MQLIKHVGNVISKHHIVLSSSKLFFITSVEKIKKHIGIQNEISKSFFSVGFRSSRPVLFCKKCVLRNFAKFTGPSQNSKETLAQVFSCEFCKILKNIFFDEHLHWLLL